MAKKNSLVWDGMAEYRAALRKLPEECKVEVLKLIEDGVNAAYVAVAQVYDAHIHTGTLRNRLRVKTEDNGLELVSGSPIAWLFDNGSQARHYTGTDKRGRVFVKADRGKMWGKTPPTHIFAKTVAKERRQLTAQYKDLLLRLGADAVTVDDE